MSDCPFCLANCLLEGEILDRDEWCYAVTTEDPVLRDSIMIIPHRHGVTVFDLTDDEWRSTRHLLTRAKQRLDAAGVEGYSIGWNVGEIGGQSVPHAHLHVIGRFADEPMAGHGIRHALKQESNRRPGQARQFS